jgi:hypothetical protein
MMHCILCKMISLDSYIYIYIYMYPSGSKNSAVCFASVAGFLYIFKSSPIYEWMRAPTFHPRLLGPFEGRERERCKDKKGWDVPWHIYQDMPLFQILAENTFIFWSTTRKGEVNWHPHVITKLEGPIILM